MDYQVELKPQATRDLAELPQDQVRRILKKIYAMQNDLAGDVKRLTNFVPQYRLRVGDYRVLFDLEGSKVMIYRIRHRRDVYRG
jgi:mRNA interferase RelE/StbE